MQGKFITVEGIDGAGKSSVTAALNEFLNSQGIELFTTREPGGTELAEELRSATLKHRREEVLPVTEVLMLFAGRAQHLHEKIRPALMSGKWVLSDRFSDSTIAYQGGGHRVDIDFLFRLADQVHGDLWPDRTYLLDVPVDIGLGRKTGTLLDRIETQDINFFERTRSAYLKLADMHERIIVVDSSSEIETVLEFIYADIQQNFIANG